MTTSVSINRTTELRWFFDGPIPADVLRWFIGDRRGLSEARRDHYLWNDLDDVGVKRRAGLTLERKTRVGPPAVMSLGIGAIGIVETWERWSPADLVLDLGEEHLWLDVEKSRSRSSSGASSSAETRLRCPNTTGQ